MTELLTTKQLADKLHRSVDYISAMKVCGYVPAIPATNGHTLEGAVAWLQRHPDFRYRKAYPQARVKRIRKNSDGFRQMSPSRANKKGVKL